MSAIGSAKRKVVANFWKICMVAVVASLFSLSFSMLVKAQILYGLAGSLGISRSMLDTASSVLGVAGLMVGISSAAACIVGSMLKKY